MLLRVLRSTATLLTGLYAGGVLFVAIAPSVLTLSPEAFLRYWQALNLDYRVLPPFLLVAQSLLGATTWLSRRRGSTVMIASALATTLLLVSILITITRMLPLNEATNALTPNDIPADFPQTVRQWWSLHLLRTAAGVGAFVSILVSSTVDSPDRGIVDGKHQKRAVVGTIQN